MIGLAFLKEYWIEQLNLLLGSIKINKWSFGTSVEEMDLDLYKDTKCFEHGKSEIQLHQDAEN